jgi:hypothetical protein
MRENFTPWLMCGKMKPAVHWPFAEFPVGIGIAKENQQSVLTVAMVPLNSRPCPRNNKLKL